MTLTYEDERQRQRHLKKMEEREMKLGCYRLRYANPNYNEKH